jgi:hypothetical protein
VIALTVMVVGLQTALSAEPTGTLTLACEGTETSQWGSGPKSSEKVNIGIIVDLQKKTVTGLEPTTPLTIDDLRSPLAECRAAGITKVSLGI